MLYGKIAGINIPVARIIQGTTMIGSALNDAESFELLDKVYKFGCNMIDTAHVDGSGNSERVVGR